MAHAASVWLLSGLICLAPAATAEAAPCALEPIIIRHFLINTPLQAFARDDILAQSAGDGRDPDLLLPACGLYHPGGQLQASERCAPSPWNHPGEYFFLCQGMPHLPGARAEMEKNISSWERGHWRTKIATSL